MHFWSLILQNLYLRILNLGKIELYGNNNNNHLHYQYLQLFQQANTGINKSNKKGKPSQK